MRVGIGLFIVVDLVNITLNLLPCRKQFMVFSRIKDTHLNHIIVTEVIIFSAIGIIIGYPEIIGLFGICGGIFCTLVGWAVPFMIMIRIYGIAHINSR